MKKLILILILIVPVLTFCQEEIKKKEHKLDPFPKLKFDFLNKNYIIIPTKIKQGEFYQIEIDSINLNQYLVQIESKDTTYSTGLKFPTFGTLDLSSLESFTENLSLKTIEGIQQDKMKGEKFKEFIKTLTIENTVIKTIKDVKNDYNMELDNLKTINIKIDDKKYDYMTYRICRQTNENCDNYKLNIIEDLKVYSSIRIDLKVQSSQMKKYKMLLHDFINQGSIQKFLKETDNVELKKELIKISEEISKLSDKVNEAIALVSPDNIEKQLKLALNLYEKNEYVSLPIQFNGEEAHLKIKFIPKDTSANLQPYTLPIIKFPVRKTYWSVGASMYYAGFENQRISHETIQEFGTDTINKYKILKETDLNGETGVAVLLRGGKKFTNSFFGWHGSAGTGLSLGEDSKPRMLLGGGISYGQKHSFALDFGFIGGFVKNVSSNIDYSKEYIEKPDVFINKFQTKMFLSIGYVFRI